MNFVCLVFELGDKTLTLSPMENLMVKCNLHVGVLVKDNGGMNNCPTLASRIGSTL